MKKKIVPVTKHFSKKAIGELMIDEDELPKSADYRFEIGGIVKEKKGDTIIKFQLREVSLITGGQDESGLPKNRKGTTLDIYHGAEED
jgi:hypothetical protein